MAESIGNLYPTQIASLSEIADIQEAFRLYHYGAPSGTASGEYDPTNTNPLNLVNPSIAYSLNNLQTQITSLSGSLGVQATNWTAKGVLVTATAASTLYPLTLGSEGAVLTVDSGAASGMSWQSPVVTLTNTVTLSGKTLLNPRISSGSYIADINGNELIMFPTAVSSAVNEITVTNATTGNKPTISATGNDTNISLNLVGKGTGTVQVNNIDIVTTTASQTLTNKTLTAPSISQGYITDSITFEGSTDDTFETTVSVIDPTADRTINLPNASGTVALTANKLSDFAATSSSELAGIISDETGSGSLVFGTAPTISNAVISNPTLTISTSSSTTDARISWDTTNKKIQVGNGTSTLDFPSFTVNPTPKTGAYPLVLSDQNTLIQMNGAFAFTVPLNSTVAYPVGTQIHLLALTTGVSVTFTSGITSYSTPGTKLRAAGSMATLVKLNTDTWVLTGDLSA